MQALLANHRYRSKFGDWPIILDPQTIHRETTGQDSDVEAFIVRVGGEPEHVKVESPNRMETVGGG